MIIMDEVIEETITHWQLVPARPKTDSEKGSMK